jgi:tetratricopeptide (TPR) repeat protein
VDLYLLSGQAELADAQLRTIENSVGADLKNRPENASILQFVRQKRLRVSLVLGRYSDAIETIQQNLLSARSEFDRLRQNVLDDSMRLYFARLSGTPAGLPLIEIMLMFNQPAQTESLQRIQQAVVSGNHAQPSPFDLSMAGEQIIGTYFRFAEAEANMRLELGLLYLEQGNNPAALAQFTEITKILPAATRSNTLQLARIYRKLLREL